MAGDPLDRRPPKISEPIVVNHERRIAHIEEYLASRWPGEFDPAEEPEVVPEEATPEELGKIPGPEPEDAA